MTYYLNHTASIKNEINSENFTDNSELLVKLNQHLIHCSLRNATC